VSGPAGAGGDPDELGTLAREGTQSVLRFRRRLAHPREKVWRALTEDAHLAAWFPTTIEGDRAAGAPLHFSFRQAEAAPFDGRMLAFDPPGLMELRWADDVLRFELVADGDAACVVSLTVTFPEHGKAARDGTGWHVCLDQLVYECDGSTPPWQPPERWRALHPDYVASLGAAASVLGPPEEWERGQGQPG
jgi:uncharacterized protein YndB with AHSA1/START domain